MLPGNPSHGGIVGRGYDDEDLHYLACCGYEMRHVLSLFGGAEKTGRMRLFHASYKYFHYWHLLLIFACMASLVVGLRVTYIQGCSPESFMFLTEWFHDD